MNIIHNNINNNNNFMKRATRSVWIQLIFAETKNTVKK